MITKLLSLLTILTFEIQVAYTQPDSTVFTYHEYIENLKKYHPIVKQAELKLKFGKAELLKAKGNFDPTINSSYGDKNFNDILYYRQFYGKLKIPTPLGLDVVSGYENNSGSYLNPESSTSPNGLWHLGIEIDVLQGLLVNERSTVLNQAKVFQEIANNERQILLNEILYDATNAYLQWQLFHYVQNVLVDNLTNTKTYFNDTKQSYFGGEKTAMDTLEAYILFQDATLALQKNEMELVASKLYVENFLWYNSLPISLQNSTVPDDLEKTLLPEAKVYNNNSTAENNPLILSKINKLSILEIEQKLKREKLKPKLKLKYHPLLSTSNNNLSPTFSIDNYTWGMTFSMPLLLRSERAEIKQGNLKIRDQELEIDNKKNELQNKIDNSLQQILLLEEQSLLLRQNIENYKKLLDGEFEKYRLGESSVFLLNKRQEKYINARLKLVDINIKRNKEHLNYLYYTNQLFDK